VRGRDRISAYDHELTVKLSPHQTRDLHGCTPTMTRDTADKVVLAPLSAVRGVNDNVLLVQPEVSEAMYTEYKKRSGEVMAAIYIDLMKPIVKDHPDLDPGVST
jgi:hypothetical protein